MNFVGTFDTTTALAGMFLWIVFNYLSGMLNCDLQRLMKNPLVLHMVGLTAFFFLFALLDTNNKTSILIIWLKTVFVYAMFVLMTKSKWYFVLPVLALLLVDQTLKRDMAFKEAAGEEIDDKMKSDRKRISSIINILIIAIIVVGTLHYGILQKRDHKNDFSFTKLIFGVSRCKSRPRE